MKINIEPIKKDPKYISNKVLVMSITFHVVLFFIVGFIDLV